MFIAWKLIPTSHDNYICICQRFLSILERVSINYFHIWATRPMMDIRHIYEDHYTRSLRISALVHGRSRCWNARMHGEALKGFNCKLKPLCIRYTALNSLQTAWACRTRRNKTEANSTCNYLTNQLISSAIIETRRQYIDKGYSLQCEQKPTSCFYPQSNESSHTIKSYWNIFSFLCLGLPHRNPAAPDLYSMSPAYLTNPIRSDSYDRFWSITFMKFFLI